MPRKERKVGKSSKLGAPKPSLFKKGGWNSSKERSTKSYDTPTCSDLPDSSDAESPEVKLERITQQEALDIQFIRSSSSSEPEQNRDVLGYRLRPKPEKEENHAATEKTSAENVTGCYPRNFACLVHSAIHSRTLGPGHSIIKLARAVGLRVPENSIMDKQLKAKDTLRRYDKRIKSSAKHKETRYFQRKRRNHRTLPCMGNSDQTITVPINLTGPQLAMT